VLYFERNLRVSGIDNPFCNTHNCDCLFLVKIVLTLIV